MDRFDATLIAAASRLGNHESLTSGPRVTVEAMRRGGVGVALSVLCTPLLEMGNHYTRRYRRKPPYGGPPEDRYLAVLLRQLSAVEARVQYRHAGRARIVRSPQELDEAVRNNELALVHCVEGAFSLGASQQSIRDGVHALACRGVAYVTIAHLVWRHMATNAPAIPAISDRLYNWIFPQPDIGLSDLGRAVIRAMVTEGVLVDITHMSTAAVEDTLALMDDLDPDRSVPVIASHSAFRFGRHEYNLPARTVERIAARGGVIGLILSPHFLADGLNEHHSHTWKSAFEIFCSHIDQIRTVTGSHHHVALGSDLDGFIKPTLAGLEGSHKLGRLGPALAARYGSRAAQDIAATNALRVLRTGWRGAPPPTPSGSG
jgi:microsomal dipeptidase-like Zn-dependent dipeptidase